MSAGPSGRRRTHTARRPWLSRPRLSWGARPWRGRSEAAIPPHSFCAARKPGPATAVPPAAFSWIDDRGGLRPLSPPLSRRHGNHRCGGTTARIFGSVGVAVPLLRLLRRAMPPPRSLSTAMSFRGHLREALISAAVLRSQARQQVSAPRRSSVATYLRGHLRGSVPHRRSSAVAGLRPPSPPFVHGDIPSRPSSRGADRCGRLSPPLIRGGRPPPPLPAVCPR